MEEEKIYVGNGKELFGGDVITFSLDLTKLGQAKEHFFEYNGNKYIKLKVCKKRDGEDQFGKTHYVQVDTFKPEPKQEEPEQKRYSQQEAEEEMFGFN